MTEDAIPIFIIPGDQITSLDSFYKVMGEVVNGPGGYFGTNLDAFNDCLYGGWGTPDDSRCIFRWVHSDLSKMALGHEGTVKWIRDRIENAHPTNRPHFVERLIEAEAGRGKTLFDMIVEIFGDNADRVELILD